MRKKEYYHATATKNLKSILKEGLKTGCDGLVYLSENERDALKFVGLRGANNITIIKVSLSEKEVFETFDHSFSFFKCKSFGCLKNIPVEDFKSITNYTIKISNGEEN